jgi:hypothetical protein
VSPTDVGLAQLRPPLASVCFIPAILHGLPLRQPAVSRFPRARPPSAVPPESAGLPTDEATGTPGRVGWSVRQLGRHPGSGRVRQVGRPARIGGLADRRGDRHPGSGRVPAARPAPRVGSGPADRRGDRHPGSGRVPARYRHPGSGRVPARRPTRRPAPRVGSGPRYRHPGSGRVPAPLPGSPLPAPRVGSGPR